MKSKQFNKIIKKLGDSIDSKISGHLTFVGILTGGVYLAKGLEKYLRTKGRKVSSFSIKVNKEKKLISQGKNRLRKENKTSYVFVDDAIWSALTKNIVIEEVKKKGIKNYKYVVILDPFNLADFSVFS